MIFLKEKRIERGLTRNDLGALVGIHPQQIYNIEVGKAAIPLKYVSKFAKHLRVRKHVLLDLVIKDKTARYLK